ncbi:hypothetical protein HDG34_007658 [Paraburkholderia sp. HC6.4b]|uniref:hypothetical protein n=1 Tax=unclassified Paraburkholderia TaxID=2615204 RepID=UPI00160B7383|nr:MULTISPECIES: hypothetical protein [unclassified Paraburkholderia]MBB5413680.1 hypothetical protein [Paraburkholderia sp. HC6.4b]MBB5456089.1 hypothetical protein [Paraburkholderia sp. Kb1A]
MIAQSNQLDETMVIDEQILDELERQPLTFCLQCLLRPVKAFQAIEDHVTAVWPRFRRIYFGFENNLVEIAKTNSNTQGDSQQVRLGKIFDRERRQNLQVLVKLAFSEYFVLTPCANFFKSIAGFVRLLRKRNTQSESVIDSPSNRCLASAVATHISAALRPVQANRREDSGDGSDRLPETKPVTTMICVHA